jgi:vacuolar-type H+-ATPase subunit C/Vma6
MLAGELARRGYPATVGDLTSSAALELTARRTIASRLTTLLRWAGPRATSLAVIFEDEDRRSIAALLRGAVQMAPSDQRLSGLIPTPELPERALEELAHQQSATRVVSLLGAWRHPLAADLGVESTRPQPDLLRLEHRLNLTFATRALHGAHRDGRKGLLVRHVRRVIDIGNAYTALVLLDDEKDRLEELWVPGGGDLTQDLARRAIAAGDAPIAREILAAGMRGPRIAAAFATREESPAGIEAAVIAALAATYEATARLEPLSVAPLLAFAMHLRAEALDVRRLIWGVSLGAPAGTLLSGLVGAR